MATVPPLPEGKLTDENGNATPEFKRWLVAIMAILRRVP
jgi:hypothetical protein